VFSRDFDAGGFEPGSGAVNHHLSCSNDTVNARGIFCRGKFFAADCLQDNRFFAQRQGVKDEGFEFYAVGLRRLDEIAFLVDIRDFLYGPMQRQRETVVIKAFGEIDADGVDCDTAKLKDKRAVGIFLFRKLIGEVAVLDNGDFAVGHTEVAEFFEGACFGEGLRGHFGVVDCVQADEEGVEDIDEGIINLPVADEFDTAFFHIGQGPAIVERAQSAAVAVGRGCDCVEACKEDFAVQGEIRESSLPEYEDVIFIQPIVIVGVEDFERLFVIERACHYVPGAGCAVFFTNGGNCFGEDLKESFIFDWADGEVALWAVEAEPCPLASCDDKCGDLAL